MLYDLETLFSDDQAITADAASTNVVKMSGGKFKEVSFGTPMPLRIQCTETFTGTSVTSVEIKVQTDDNESFSSPTTLATTGAVPAASLVAGYVAPINFVPKGNEGYMRLYYDVTLGDGGSISAGKFTAGIVAADEGSFHNM